MSKTAIIYYSGYGHTTKQANAVLEGAASINGDKYGTINYFFTLAMQHGMMWIGTGLLPANTKAATRNDVNWLGGFAGALAQSPSDSSPEEGPLPGDLETARMLGVRVAELAKRIY